MREKIIEKKSRILVLVSLIFFLSLFLSFNVSASIFINEIEINPSGSNSGNQWVEIFNDATSVNISGWYISDKDGNNFSINNKIIGQNEFYVIDGLSGINVDNQNLKLFRNNGALADQSGVFSDSFNDDQTYSRNPDGGANFEFMTKTKGESNVIVNIVSTTSPECVIKGESFELNAKVEGYCITSVIFGLESDNGWINFSGNTLNGNDYFVKINSSQVNISQDTHWNVYAQDCFNRTDFSLIENFYLNEKTILIINPISPDGLNNWYLTSPIFSLINLDAQDIYYRWGSASPIKYSGNFGLESLPNNGNVSAGSLELNYWSELSCKTEEEKTSGIKVDLTNPVIKDILPVQDSKIFTNNILVYAYLDEIYQGNSGINKSNIILKIDDNEVSAKVKPYGSLDAKVEYLIEDNLSYGIHTINLKVYDNAGRESEKQWSFEAIEPNITIIINEPMEGNYQERRMNVNISLEGETGLLQYINHNDRRPKYKRLCSKCSGYGFDKNKAIFFNEGFNNISFMAVGEFSGKVVEKNVVFFIDSVKPRVSSVYPKHNKLTNGEEFIVKYSEDNLENLSLIIDDGTILVGNCTSGRNQECYFYPLLDSTNLSVKNYYFQLSDILNVVQSKVTRIFLDNTKPEITVYLPENITYIDRRVPFNLSVSETSSIEIKDLSDTRKVEKRLCSKCLEYGYKSPKTMIFKPGYHQIQITATDIAGNKNTKIVEFSLV